MEIVKRSEGYRMSEENYWDMTREIWIDTKIGEDRREGIINDEETTRRVMEEYGIENQERTVFYTDGSKSKSGVPTGVAFVQEDNEEVLLRATMRAIISR